MLLRIPPRNPLWTLCLLLALSPRPAGAAEAPGTSDWPQWRGLHRDGVWRGVKLPGKLSRENIRERWRVPIGAGYSGIAVSGKRVLTQDRRKEPVPGERVICLDRATGKLLWEHAYPADYGDMDHGNGPRATPAVHDGRVYTIGARGRAACLDLESGKPLWEVDLAAADGARLPIWGHAASPLIAGDLVVLQAAYSNGTLAAFDRLTGEERWRALADRPGYSSPLLVEGPDRSDGSPTGAPRTRLLHWTADALHALEPGSGAVLWSVPFKTSSFDVAIISPVLYRGRLFVSGYWDGTRTFAVGEEPQPRLLWENRDPSCLMATPLSSGDHLYALDKRDGLLGIEWSTGKVLWNDGHRLTPKGRNPHASMVWVEGTLRDGGGTAAALNSQGELIIARLTPSGCEELGRAPLIEPAGKDPIWAHPAFAGQEIFARNDREILCAEIAEVIGTFYFFEDEAPGTRIAAAETVECPPLPADRARAVTARLLRPEDLSADEKIPVEIRRGGAAVARKHLHALDPDLFVLVQGGGDAAVEIRIGEPGGKARAVEARAPAVELGPNAAVETEPNDAPEQATPFVLGRTVFASADDRPFVPAPGEDEEAEKAAGIDWYTFTLAGSEPKLVYLSADFLDREVPADVALFRIEEGKPVPHLEGFERYEPERSTRYYGQHKFIARRLEPGTYHLRVRANHPAYQLRSDVHPAPPFDPEKEGGLRPAAEKAVRAAMDYIVLKGDAWHANTPRVGGVDDRRRNVHAETAQCIACHPTHFSTRAEMFAAANGYPVRQRPQVLFLTERLYNNPRPFHGHPQAAWARMISASANVLGRLSMMLDLFERRISGFARDSVHRDVAGYLDLYYKGREELPGDESNGNRPLVSAFEVAIHSWMVLDGLHRRGAGPEYAARRDHVRRLIETAGEKHVGDMLDLCYQTIALCRIDCEGHAERIRANVERIFGYQRPDGRWPMGFGDKDPPAEFQTGHCLYTLALAGVPADEPRVEKALRWLLNRQHPFGGWFDDSDPKNPHPYENFQTPFRETQFAIMALSEFFPGKGGGGWHAGFDPPPRDIDGGDIELLEAMDFIWERPGDAALEKVRAALASENPLAREQAAACLGRIGDDSSVEALAAALADPSKLVRRAAAWSLRQLGNRGAGRDAVARALSGEDPWTRRGAAQVFAQHHREWTGRGDIEAILLERLADPDPWVRILAGRALWQWWQWDAAEESRSAIEDAFIARLGAEEHPAALEGLVEGFHNLLDDNVRYLYNNWIPLLGTAADREQATAGHRAGARRQAEKIAAALRSGSERQVKALLRSVGFFHLRSGTYASRGRFSRIGNDVETVQFYDDAAPVLRAALEPHLASSDPEIRGPALLAAFTLRGTGSEAALGIPFLRGLGDPDPFTRGVAVEFHRNFLPPVNESTEPELLETIAALLAADSPEGRRAAFDLTGKLELSPAARARLAEPMRKFLEAGDDKLLPQALRAVAGLPALWKDVSVLQRVAGALQSEDAEHRKAAVRLALEADPIGGARIIQRRLDTLFGPGEKGARKEILQLGAAEKSLAAHARFASLASEALADPDDAELRRLALDLVRASDELQSIAAVRAAVAKLLSDPNERTRQVAEAVYSGKKLKIYEGDVEKLLDYGFFRARVQPILFEKGADGNACADCHHNHGILKINGPDDGGALAEALERENYLSALKVVNLAEPERSLLLQKPLGSADLEGVVGAKTVPHGGERRWTEGSASPAYRTILQWINGARLEEARAAGD